jgi:hypothetical protein
LAPRWIGAEGDRNAQIPIYPKPGFYSLAQFVRIVTKEGWIFVRFAVE